jgi:hypothetical protein
MKTLLSVLVTVIMLQGCNKKQGSDDGKPILYQQEEFKNYWYAGKAEVNTYHLSQSRYGESREGKAVLIFVTEDFSRKDQVKTDRPAVSDKNKISVLKMNFTKNFITGIYPYSMMLSVFTPVNRDQHASSLKVTMSSQEWCGHVFTQLNLRGKRFAVKSHSYFEQEGDENFTVQQAILEDELWNYIRLDHQNLPIGKIDIVPGLFFTRLKHVDLRVHNAMASRTEKDSAYNYNITFPELERTLTIEFEKQFPHKILKWTEAWKEGGKLMQTSATLNKTRYIDYWTKNKNEHQFLRDSLGLDSKL